MLDWGLLSGTIVLVTLAFAWRVPCSVGLTEEVVPSFFCCLSRACRGFSSCDFVLGLLIFGAMFLGTLVSLVKVVASRVARSIGRIEGVASPCLWLLFFSVFIIAGVLVCGLT